MTASGVSVLVSLSFAFVGIGLWAYYEQVPLTGVAAEIVAEQPDRVFAVFAVEAVAVGLKALVVAGALAAAVSSLDSILAALAQTTSALLRSRTRPGNGVRLPRLLVLGWGLVLGLTSLAMDTVAARYDALLDLALAMAGYTGGALLAAVALSLAPFGRDGRGFLWSGPLSALAVFAAVWHQPAAGWFCLLGCVVLLGTWLRRDARGRLAASFLLVVGAALVMGLWRWAEGPGGAVLAWPWYVPLGAVVAWVWGLGLSGRAEPGAVSVTA